MKAIAILLILILTFALILFAIPDEEPKTKAIIQYSKPIGPSQEYPNVLESEVLNGINIKG